MKLILSIIFILFHLDFAFASKENDFQKAVVDEIRRGIKVRYGIEDKKEEYEEKVVIRKRKTIKEKKPKQLSKGERKVQEMLRKNRERLRQRSQKVAKPSGGDWMSSKKNEQDQWSQQKVSEILRWEKEKKKILARWSQDKKRFLKEVKEYKKDLTPIKVPKKEEVKTKEIITEEIKLIKKYKTLPSLREFHLIKGAFYDQVKNQGRRPTCASFSAIRALEILASRSGKNQRLSEQYFYYSSKPRCKQSPCSKRGSWVVPGFQHSLASSSPDIPLEKDCPYSSVEKSGNQTQIPLPESCNKGFLKVKNFKKVSSQNEILKALNRGEPVIGGFRLAGNFYRNNGHIFIEKGLSLGKDHHAEGHAILLVGHMKLPKKLHASQGQYCYFVANSWGEGWGKGGHACISQKWFEKYRYPMPFVAVSSVGF